MEIKDAQHLFTGLGPCGSKGFNGFVILQLVLLHVLLCVLCVECGPRRSTFT